MAVSYTAPRIELEEAEKELNELDCGTKEQLRRDLYGDYADMDETPEFLANSLIQLQNTLEAIEPCAKQAYLRAKEECPNYVNSEEFLLLFLRAERFNASLAANRIVAYWEQKVLLFPNDKEAFGPISLDMLQESDLRVLRNAGLSLLPNDRHGRAVIHVDREAIQLKINGRAAPVSLNYQYSRSCLRHCASCTHWAHTRILSLTLIPFRSLATHASLPYARRR